MGRRLLRKKWFREKKRRNKEKSEIWALWGRSRKLKVDISYFIILFIKTNGLSNATSHRWQKENVNIKGRV